MASIMPATLIAASVIVSIHLSDVCPIVCQPHRTSIAAAKMTHQFSMHYAASNVSGVLFDLNDLQRIQCNSATGMVTVTSIVQM